MVQAEDINFRTLVHEVYDGIYVCDRNGTFIYANLSMAEIFGFEHSEDIIGKNFEEFFSPGNKHIFMNEFQKSMGAISNSTLIASEINRHDGETAYIEVYPMPFIKDGKLIGSQGVVRDVTKRRQAENQMMYMTTHDSLTGIYNRTFFEAEMQRLERGRQFPISIIMSTVEVSKNSRESEEHAGGEKILKHVAQKLFRLFRSDDIVARIGEDEFAILLPSVDENMVDGIVKRLRGNFLKKTVGESEQAFELYIGAKTAKAGEKLNLVLKQAEVIAYLEKKNNKTPND